MAVTTQRRDDEVAATPVDTHTDTSAAHDDLADPLVDPLLADQVAADDTPADDDGPSENRTAGSGPGGKRHKKSGSSGYNDYGHKGKKKPKQKKTNNYDFSGGKNKKKSGKKHGSGGGNDYGGGGKVTAKSIERDRKKREKKKAKAIEKFLELVAEQRWEDAVTYLHDSKNWIGKTPRQEAWLMVSPGERLKLAQAFHGGQGRDYLEATVFEVTPDGETETLHLLFEAMYRADIAGTIAEKQITVPFDGPTCKRVGLFMNEKHLYNANSKTKGMLWLKYWLAEGNDAFQEAIDNDDYAGAYAILKDRMTGTEQQAKAFAALTPEQREDLAGQFTYADLGANTDLLDTLFEQTPDADVGALQGIFKARYNMDTQSGDLHSEYTVKDWDAVGLRESWKVLGGLPKKHVEDNTHVQSWLRYEGGHGNGFHWEYKNQVAFAYDSDEASMKKDNSRNTGDDDVLKDTNQFEQVVTHEIGHAVDRDKGMADSHKHKAWFGEWEDHGVATADLVDTLIDGAAGDISKLADKDRDVVAQVMLDNMTASEPDKLEDELKAARNAAGTGRALRSSEVAKVIKDPAAQTILKAGKGKDPWYKADGGGVNIGERHYQDSKTNKWNSYARDAQNQRVSPYQMKSPREWFAEAYVAYYDSKNAVQGDKLKKANPDAKEEFDKLVKD